MVQKIASWPPAILWTMILRCPWHRNGHWSGKMDGGQALRLLRNRWPGFNIHPLYILSIDA